MINWARFTYLREAGRLLKRNEWMPCHRVIGFLATPVAQRVLTQIFDKEDSFCPLTGNRNFLRLPKPLELLPEFYERLWTILPEMEARFGIDLERPEIELYVHAYNNGTRFDCHSDAHGGGNWKRRISCVYYLHREPRGFNGGELVIYDRYGRTLTVEPQHNSAIFFPSYLIHEVLPVICHSKKFIDSRFAINVWIM